MNKTNNLYFDSVDIYHDARFDMEFNWHNHVVPNLPANHTAITIFNSWGGIRGWRFVPNPSEPVLTFKE
jgi:hypothetical protein